MKEFIAWALCYSTSGMAIIIYTKFTIKEESRGKTQ
jgi:hypothetical protein